MDSDNEFVMISSDRGSEASQSSPVSTPYSVVTSSFEVESIADEESRAATPEPAAPQPLEEMLKALSVVTSHEQEPDSPMLTPIPELESPALPISRLPPSARPVTSPVIPPLRTALFPPLTTKLEKPSVAGVNLEMYQNLEANFVALMRDNERQKAVIQQLTNDNVFFAFSADERDAELSALRKENRALRKLKTTTSADIEKIRAEQLQTLETIREHARLFEKMFALEKQLAQAHNTIAYMDREIKNCHETLVRREVEGHRNSFKCFDRDRTETERQLLNLQMEFAVCSAELSASKARVKELEAEKGIVEEEQEEPEQLTQEAELQDNSVFIASRPGPSYEPFDPYPAGW